MSDVILKIYSGTGATWAQTLQYTITEVVDYNITDECGYAIDTAYFKIEDIDKVFATNINADISGTTSVWRAFSTLDGKMIGSGIIIRTEEAGSYLEIFGESMSSLLKRRMVEDYSITGDGSKTYDYILTDSTNGLLQGSSEGLLPSADYLTFNLSQYLVATTNKIPNATELKYDNMTLYAVLVDICKKSYGANNRSYDAYLFEMDADTLTAKPTFTTADNKFKMCLYFKEKNSTSSASLIDGSMIDTRAVKWSKTKSADNYYNKITIRGGSVFINPCPVDYDYWTESSTDGWSGWYGSVSSNGASTVGDYSINLDISTADATDSLTLDLTDTGTVDNSTYCPTSLFSSGNGFILNDDIEQRVRFYLRFDADAIASLETVWLLGYDDTDSGYQSFKTLFSSSGSMPIADNWYLFDFPVKDLVSSNGLYFTTLEVMVGSTGVPTGDPDMYIDGLHFYTNDYQVSGTKTAAGVTTYYKELIQNDHNLITQKQCEDVADDMLKELNGVKNTGIIPILGPFRNFDLVAGNTIEFSVPSLGVDVTSGQTPSKFEIERIVYSPNRQTVFVGRFRSIQEIFEDSKQKVQKSYIQAR